MKTAIVYYSRRGGNWFDGNVVQLEVGNTELLSSYLKEVTGGDLFSLQMKHPYSDDYDICVNEAKEDQINHVLPELREIPDLSIYDEIYLGYPIFWEDLPQPVISFLSSVDLSGKRIYPFSTHEGSGLGASVSHIKELQPQAEDLSPLPFPGSLVKKGYNRIKNWVEKNQKQ